jgi:hypothetical protein
VDGILCILKISQFLEMEDQEEDENETVITDTIAKAGEDIRPLINIFNNERLQDEKGADDRQRDSSVTAFMTMYRDVTSANFYDRAYKWNEKITDARCFLMVLNQLYPGKKERRVSSDSVRTLLCSHFFSLWFLYRSFLYYTNNNL